MKLQRTVFSVILSLLASFAHAQIVITELMQSNIDCIMDDMNEFPDSWVEIYNSGTTQVSLNNYSIGVSENPQEAWRLPADKLGPGAYKLVYCDKESKGYHTNFRLDSGKGGSVYLFENNALTNQVLNIPKQPAPNISYGLSNVNAGEWAYQLQATPGSRNTDKKCLGVLGEPVFSIPGGVFSSSQTAKLEITLPPDAPEGTVIRYTMNGQEPTESSVKYQNAIALNYTRVIRAKLFCDGYVSPRSTTHSYIIHPREVTLPVVSIVTDNSYFYDNKTGIYVDGTYSGGKKNYQYNWRRPANFEYFENAGVESSLNQLCELRCAGAASRGFSLKSLALYANKRFGEKHFKYEFFPEQRPGAKDFKSIVMRNAGNDFDYLYMRDAIIQQSVARHVDIDYQAWQPAIFYLNGKYMGMLNIRERGNESNIYTNYDHLEDIDILENWGELKEGTWDNISAFKQFYSEHGHTLEEYSQWMDVEEFINYMAMNIYYDNVDFPANNIMMWRPRTADGRWRFIAKDADYSLGIYDRPYNYKYLNWINDNSYDSSLSWGNTADGTRLFRRMMEDEDIKRLFLDRMAIFMGSFLSYNHVWKETWEPMYEKIKDEYPHHREPINRWWPNYGDELKKAQTWLKNRTSFFYKHMSDYYKTGTMAMMVVNNQLTDDEKGLFRFTFNGIELCGGGFDGQYFPGHEITLTAEPLEDKVVTQWSVMKVGMDGKTTNDIVKGNTYSMIMPSCTRLQLNAVYGNDEAGIESVEETDYGIDLPVEIYDINGIRHETLQPGVNIVKFRNGSVRKVKY